MNSMHRFLVRGLLIIAVTVYCCGQLQAESTFKKPELLQSELTALNLKVGQLVKHVPGFTTKGWKYLTPWNIAVAGSESQSYLVTFQNKCYGLHLKRSSLFPTPSVAGQLARNDNILIKNYGQTIAHCKVKEVHQLDQI